MLHGERAYFTLKFFQGKTLNPEKMCLGRVFLLFTLLCPVGFFMFPFYWLALTLVNLYWWVVFLAFLFDICFRFGLLNPHNRFLGEVHYTFFRLTEPSLAQVRRFLPKIGGVDLSYLALLLLLEFLTIALRYYWGGVLQ